MPVVLDDTDDVPEPLAARQYVYIRDEDDFDASLQALTDPLATDLDGSASTVSGWRRRFGGTRAAATAACCSAGAT